MSLIGAESFQHLPRGKYKKVGLECLAEFAQIYVAVEVTLFTE